MAGTLDPELAAHVQDGAEREGIRVLTGTPVERIEAGSAGHADAVHAGGERIAADLVVVATGVRPAVALARDAGLAIGETGAIAVDDHQRLPGHDGVFAAGDCVESWHRVLGRPVNLQLGTHANKQGRVAGVNATGGDKRFAGVVGTAVSRICSVEVARTGLGEAEARAAGFDVAAGAIEATTRARYFPGSGPIWVKLVAERGSGRLLGGQIVGTEGAAKRVDVLATAIWAGLTVEDVAELDLGYAPPVAPVFDPLLTAAFATLKALAEG
jgi:NADPH-dependent 2,4-dienoyl-CoA reductase/sulfur reductase-like enzyme